MDQPDGHALSAADVDAAMSPAGTALPAIEGDGHGTCESDKLYLEYCRAKWAEEVRGKEARRSAQHSELKSIMVSLGQSMESVAGAVHSYGASETVAAQRHSESLVSISHYQVSLLTVVESPASTLGTMRSARRQRMSRAPSGSERDPARPPLVNRGDSETELEGVLPPVRQDVLFTATMEAELMADRMVSSLWHCSWSASCAWRTSPRASRVCSGPFWWMVCTIMPAGKRRRTQRRGLCCRL